MKWVLENLGLVVVLAVGAVSFLRTVFRAAKGDEPRPPRSAPAEDPEAAERTRRVQEEIRRKIAERRGALEQSHAERRAAAAREDAPPRLRPATVPPVDPFGGPMRRITETLENLAQRSQREEAEAAQREEEERQRKLTAQLRALEAQRAEERRRAAEIAAGARARKPIAAIEFAAASSLRDQLRDKGELRRAIVLREILSTPVGLR
jgi:hypothetical protein